MKLYFAPGACSLAVHIVLKELGAPHDIVRVDLMSKKTEAGADFLEVNGKGYVPALDLGDGNVLTEVSVILQYLAEMTPSANLLPASGPMERYRAIEKLHFISTEIHKYMAGLLTPAMPDDGRKMIAGRISQRLAWLDAQLANAPYLLGETYSVADSYAFTVISWSKRANFDLSPFPHVIAFLDRVGSRPAVRSAMMQEGLIPREAAEASSNPL